MAATRQRLEEFVKVLVAEERFDFEETVWHFADGSHCSTCTSGARRVALEFNGRVLGYFSKSNSSSIIGGTLCEGHDFAIIDERWIVDYWSFRVARKIQSPVLDLQNPTERDLARNLFGDCNTWETVETYESK